VCTTYIPNTAKTKPSKKITAGKAHS